MLVLEVRLSVVTDDPVSVCGGSTCFLVGCDNFSLQVVVQSRKETLTEIHITDRVDALSKLNAARNLTVAGGPVVLNSFHVPLVDNEDNLVTLFVVHNSVDVAEKFFVLLVNHHFLCFWEEDVTCLNEPVHLVGVEALLTEGSRADHSKFLTN